MARLTTPERKISNIVKLLKAGFAEYSDGITEAAMAEWFELRLTQEFRELGMSIEAIRKNPDKRPGAAKPKDPIELARRAILDKRKAAEAHRAAGNVETAARLFDEARAEETTIGEAPQQDPVGPVVELDEAGIEAAGAALRAAPVLADHVGRWNPAPAAWTDPNEWAASITGREPRSVRIVRDLWGNIILTDEPYVKPADEPVEAKPSKLREVTLF